ncbi:MAG: YdcF family protein [Clostridia bacterium]|nr:YdcF family protein [Clostridia bacterium]
MRRKSRRVRKLTRFLLIFLCVMVLAFGGIVGYICIREGKVETVLTDQMRYDAIIVLGAQVKPDRTPSVQLTWRLDAAAEAFAKHHVPIVVCGAQGSDEPCPESVIMKQYLVEERNVPDYLVLEDPDSRNTYENLENAQKLLAGNTDINRVLIVTSDYHVPRSMAIAGDLGFEAEGLGSPCLPEYWIKNHGREALAWCKYWLKKYLHISL